MTGGQDWGTGAGLQHPCGRLVRCLCAVAFAREPAAPCTRAHARLDQPVGVAATGNGLQPNTHLADARVAAPGYSCASQYTRCWARPTSALHATWCQGSVQRRRCPSQAIGKARRKLLPWPWATIQTNSTPSRLKLRGSCTPTRAAKVRHVRARGTALLWETRNSRGRMFRAIAPSLFLCLCPCMSVPVYVCARVCLCPCMSVPVYVCARVCVCPRMEENQY